MRLDNGQVGRVQSLSEHASSTGISSEIHASERRERGSSGQRNIYEQQLDYRQDPTPLESCSLADYIKLPPSPSPLLDSATGIRVEEATLQTQMELDFPKLDSALIAAILADHPDSAEAKNVLSALS